jgi:hypothetical protein
MAETESELAVYVAEAARLMAIDLAPVDLAAVTANFRNYRTLYETLRGFDPGEAFDPAAIYRP